jgi:TolB-like protein/DNA-binding winged helix-turn-helix (wHTH) protein/Tfp pilus assembly protein PilF
MSSNVRVRPSFPSDDESIRTATSLVAFGPFTLDLKSGDLRKFGYRIKLQPKSFLVLQALLLSAGEMVTREDLKTRLWPENTFVEFESSLNVAVRRLREALSDDAQNPIYIETVPRNGYRFIGPCEYLSVPPTPVPVGLHSVPPIAIKGESPAAAPTELSAAAPKGNWRWTWIAALVLAALCLAGIGYRWKRAASAHSVATPSSIAVLPFADLSRDKNQDYFSEGLADDLRNDLARIPGLRVAARSSSFQFHEQGADLAAIGQKLGVATILEGSVQKAEKRVRISVALVKADDGFQLWSGRYDRNLTDVFAVQDEIARAISSELKGQLLKSQVAKSPQVTNPEAYNAYLQGRYLYERRMGNDMIRATEYFQHAVQLDPEYARAWSALAWALITRTEGAGGSSFEQGYRDAMASARRALQLDPDIAEAHAAIGRIKRSYDYDWSGAGAAFQKALALEPQNSVVLLGASGLQASLGNFEQAIVLNRRAVEIDPLSVAAHLSLGMHAYYAGQQALAADAYEKALAISPSAPDAHYLLGLVYLQQGHPEQALSEFEKNSASIERNVGQALAYAAMHRNSEADAALNHLIDNYRHDAAYQIAEIYAFRGDADQAMKWLEVAYANRDAGVAAIKGDPLLRKLTSDARFTSFLHTLGLS